MTSGQRQFLRYSLVGCVGFAVDAGLTLALVQVGHLSALTARMFSFLAGATATWFLHRSYTFQTSGGFGNWVVYLAVTSLGALLNVGAYYAWVRLQGSSSVQILIGIFWGAALALVFNFFASKYAVFNERVQA